MNWPRILARVAHDLRSPASVIVGYTRMIREGRLDDAARLQAMEQIEQAGNRILSIGRQGSDLARWTTPRADTAATHLRIPFASMLTEAVSRSDAKDAATLDLDSGSDTVAVRTLDRDSLTVALSNAITSVYTQSLHQPVRILGRRGADGLTCDILISPATSTIGLTSETHAPLEPENVDLPLVVATAIVLAHGGSIGSVAGQKNHIVISILASQPEVKS